MGKGVPNSDWNESTGARVPDVRTMDRVSWDTPLKETAEFKHQKFNANFHRDWGCLLGLSHPFSSA